VLQAHIIAQVLSQKRHKVEAGWAPWTLGFREPATAWVRAVLHGELGRWDALLKDRTRREQEIARLRGARGRPVAGTEKMRETLRPEAVAGAIALMIDIEAGAFGAEDAHQLEFEWLQDAILAEMKLSAEDERSYPTGRELALEMARIAREAPRPATQALLTRLSDPELRGLANEAQVLYEYLRRPETWQDAVMPRHYFLGYLRSQVLSPTGREVAQKLRKAVGWTRPPRTPLGRAFEQLAKDAGQPASSTTPQRTL
jgi:hypothetical protein